MNRTVAIFLLVITFCISAAAQKDPVSTREMERINWMEFKEQVPGKIRTVLPPTGTPATPFPCSRSATILPLNLFPVK